jgi:hypothetical protein
MAGPRQRRSLPDGTAISGGSAITMRYDLETVMPGHGARRVAETVGARVAGSSTVAIPEGWR